MAKSKFKTKLRFIIRFLKNLTLSIFSPEKIDWSEYRLGDMVKSLNERSKPNGEALHLVHFPMSIASKYMRRTQKASNYDVLLEVVNSYRLKVSPKTSELIVHLRVGEVIEKSEFSVEELLQEQRAYHNPHRSSYVRPLGFYQNVIQSMPANLSRVVLVAGGCHVKSFERSKHYMSAIKTLFEENGFSTSIRFGSLPDEDFAYMCAAQHFVPSGGGFSHFIAQVVRMKQGVVIEPVSR